MVLEELNVQLHTAVKTRKLDLTRDLVDRGADVNYRDPQTNSVLHIAVQHANGYLDVIQFLIKRGADINWLNREGCSPFSIAVRNSDLLVVRELVKSGAYVDLWNFAEEFPLYVAIQNKDLDIVKEILKKIRSLDFYLSKRPSLRAIHIAVNIGDIEIVQALLNAGANITLGDRYRNTPMHFAVVNSNLNVLKALLKYCTNVNLRNRWGNTALHFAVQQRVNYDNFKLSDPRIKNMFANGLIEFQLNILKELILYGAEINVKNNKFETPLSTAVKKYEVDPMCTRTLIKYTVFKFDTDYETKISLESCTKRSSDAVKNYFNECISEIAQMKGLVVSNQYSLFDVVSKGLQSGDVSPYLCPEDSEKMAGQILMLLRENKFPIYYDLVSAIIKRVDLVTKLIESELYTVSNKHTGSARRVFMNEDCKYNLVKYLPNSDLINLVIAFWNSRKHFSQNLIERNPLYKCIKRPYEGLSCNCLKSARLK